VSSRTTPMWSARSTSSLAGCKYCETKGRTRPTLRSGPGQVVCPGQPGQVVCPGQPGWPVDRTALAVGSRNPPRRLRMERSMRSVVGISGLQAGEDVKHFPSLVYLSRGTVRGKRLGYTLRSIIVVRRWLHHWQNLKGNDGPDGGSTPPRSTNSAVEKEGGSYPNTPPVRG
jgi:hypothetical protein